jgi:hypothetical protein
MKNGKAFSLETFGSDDEIEEEESELPSEWEEEEEE